MKGIEPIIAAVLVIMISMAGIIIVLENSRPSVDRMSEINIFNEAKGVLNQIDSAINLVSQEGEGSTRILNIAVSGGNYLVDDENDKIIFSMQSMSQIVGEGVTKSEGPLVISGYRDRLTIELSYSNIDMIQRESFSSGYHDVVVRNIGYDPAQEKQRITISI